MPPPDFTESQLPFGSIREEARTALFAALDARRGKKLLVLDRRLTPVLNQLVEAPLLREHGVESIAFLPPPSTAPPADPPADFVIPPTCNHLVFLLRPTIDLVPALAARVRAARRFSDDLEISALLVPRRTLAYDLALESAGVSADVSSFEVDVLMLPVEYDTLSLELNAAFDDMTLRGSTAPQFACASALLRLQQRFGVPSSVLAVGRAAAETCATLAKLQAAAPEVRTPPRPDTFLDKVLVVDRAADLVTPLLTQMTYEGLVDEILGIQHGTVEFEARSQTPGRPASGQPGPSDRAAEPAQTQTAPATKTERAQLNSSDKVFREIRDLSYAAAAAWLREAASAMQRDYRSLDAHAQSVSGMRAFVRRMHALPELTRHTTIAERLSSSAREGVFTARIRAEQELLEGAAGSADAPGALACLEAMIAEEEPVESVLRLLCLTTHAPGGIAARSWDALCHSFLCSYGHEHALTLNNLLTAGLIIPPGTGKSAYASLKKSLGLLVDAIDELEPQDAAYAFGGYTPLCVRLVERFVRGKVPVDALRSAVGVCEEHRHVRRAPNAPTAEGRRAEGADAAAPEELSSSTSSSAPRAVQQSASGAAALISSWTGRSAAMASSPAARALSERSSAHGTGGAGSPRDTQTQTPVGVGAGAGGRAGPTGRVPVLLVVLVGGACLAEISALRWLDQHAGLGYRIAVLTTNITSGRAFVRGMVPDVVRKIDEKRANIMQMFSVGRGAGPGAGQGAGSTT